MNVWTYRASWGDRWPSIGSDEHGRHTIVLPWPITRRRDDEGFPLCSAIVIALPWFPCRCLQPCDHNGERTTVEAWGGPPLVFCDECGAEL